MIASSTRRSMLGTLPDAGTAESPKAHGIAPRNSPGGCAKFTAGVKCIRSAGLCHGEIHCDGHGPDRDNEWSSHDDSVGPGSAFGPGGAAQVLLPGTSGRADSRSH